MNSNFELKKSKKILVLLTNQSTLTPSHRRPTESTDSSSMASPESRTGFDVKAVAYIWEFLKEKHGYELHFCTPSGGEAPMDPRSVEIGQSDEVVQKFLKDRSFVDQFKNTERPNRLRPEEYCAVFIPGSHGVMIDMPHCHELSQLISKIYVEQKGCIATLGHGIAALLNVPAESTSASSGTTTSILKNMRVCFSTAEEDKKLHVEKNLPYCLEEKIREKGAKIENKGPFEVNVVKDGRLLTAQNTQSAKEWIMTVVREARL